MRVQLIYKSEQRVWPLPDCIERFFTQGIRLECHQVKTDVHAELVRQNADLVIVQHEVAGKWVDAKTLVFETIDGPHLKSRRLLPQVAGIAKPWTLTPREHLNRYAWRHHCVQIRDVCGPAPDTCIIETPPKPITFEKLHVVHGFAAAKRMEILRETPVDFDAERSVPTMFYGTVKYGNNEIDLHRGLALEAVLRAGGEGKGFRKLKFPEHTELMRRTRVAVSPWGFSPICWRDYEAMLCGAVLVKPDTSFVETWPEVFIPHKTYIPCRVDFADVPDIVQEVTRNWDAYRPMRVRARMLAVEAGSRAKIVQRWCDILSQWRDA